MGVGAPPCSTFYNTVVEVRKVINHLVCQGHINGPGI